MTNPSWRPSQSARIPQGLGKVPEEAAQMLMAVGFVAWAAAQVDEVLRQLFCGLEKTKYAAVTAGGQSTNWLMDACRALAKWRDDVSVDHRNELSILFESINQCLKQRNSYVHSIWRFDDPHGPAYFAQSRRHQYFEAPHYATPDEVIETGCALMVVCKKVSAWMNKAGIKGEGVAGQMKWDAFFSQPADDDSD